MDKPRLLYFADAMCSWCYGFAPQMAAIRAHFADELDHLTFSGGLRPFTTEPMAAQKQAGLRAIYDQIASVTGQAFRQPKSMEPGFIYDSEPASRGIVTMRHLEPGLDYPFMLSIQQAFYDEGADITKAEVLVEHAARLGVEKTRFIEAFASEEMKEATLTDFRVAQQLRVDGFPTLILHRLAEDGQNQLMLVGKGYAEAGEVIERVRAALAHPWAPASAANAS